MAKNPTARELERELHILDTAHRLGRVLDRDLPNAAPLLTRLATTGYLRQVARGMYAITPDGRARLDAIGKELRGESLAAIEVTMVFEAGVHAPIIEHRERIVPGRYRAILERLP